MTAKIALASQVYAQQIAQQTGALKKTEIPQQNVFTSQRKGDIQSIFKASNEDDKAGENVPNAVKSVVAAENVSIFSDPVANSQFIASQKAKQADIQNYDTAAVSARFGGLA